MAEINLTTAQFDEEVMNSSIPVLIDFWADWCGPCRMITPFIGQIAVQYDRRVKVCKVNVDEEPELARRFNVMNIPTLVIVKNGEEADRIVGFNTKMQIARFVDGQL